MTDHFDGSGVAEGDVLRWELPETLNLIDDQCFLFEDEEPVKGLV